MSSPTYVVIPVQGDGAQRPEQNTAQIASAIQQSLHDKAHPEGHTEQSGPLKEILAHQDSLYKYINWEDPVRTLSSYVGALSILLGAHYLPLTQWALKIGAITLGAVSVTEFAGRSFGSDAILARFRPKEYTKVPESTLNATLKDIHDLIQYSVGQGQRIIFGQDLNKTFAAAVGCTALFWLIKIVSPFALAVLTLTSLFIAPLVLSPRGRKVAADARDSAAQLTNAAVDNGKALARDGKAELAHQSSKAQETARDAGRRVGDAAYSGKQTAVDVSSQAKNYASGVSQNAAQTANDAGRRVGDVAYNGKQTAADVSSQAKGYASGVSQNAAETASDAGRRVGDAAYSGKQTAYDLSAQAQGYASGVSQNVAETGRDLQGRAINAGNAAARNDSTLRDRNNNQQAVYTQSY